MSTSSKATPLCNCTRCSPSTARMVAAADAVVEASLTAVDKMSEELSIVKSALLAESYRLGESRATISLLESRLATTSAERDAERRHVATMQQTLANRTRIQDSLARELLDADHAIDVYVSGMEDLGAQRDAAVQGWQEAAEQVRSERSHAGRLHRFMVDLMQEVDAAERDGRDPELDVAVEFTFANDGDGISVEQFSDISVVLAGINPDGREIL